MNILDDFLNKNLSSEAEDFSRRDLVLFTMNLLKEVILLERNNVGSPGKAAIEFLLNQKYEIVENTDLPKSMRDQLLKEIDSVINKVVVKYKVQRKGRNFYFDESMSIVITAPDKICNTEDQLIANIYAAQSELESLRIQLTRCNLQNTSQTLLMKKAVIDNELEIQAMKKELTTFRKFDSVSDQNLLYRRSLGEAKKELETGAITGGAAGYAIGSHRYKKKMNFDKKLRDYQQANKDLKDTTKEIKGLRADARHIRKNGVPANKQKKLDKITKKVTSLVQNQKQLKKSVEKGGKKIVGLTKEAIKRGLKGAGIGAAVGTIGGLGVYASHKLANKDESANKFYQVLNKLNRIPLTEDSDDVRGTMRDVNAIRKLYKGFNGVYKRDNIAKTQNHILNLGKSNKFRVASVASLLLLGAAGIAFLIKKAREKSPEQVKNSIRSTQYRAKNSTSLTNREKTLIQNNGKLAISKIDNTFNKRR